MGPEQPAWIASESHSGHRSAEKTQTEGQGADLPKVWELKLPVGEAGLTKPRLDRDQVSSSSVEWDANQNLV